MGTSWRLDGDERQRYEADGYLVRESVFDAGEVAEIVVACEELVAGLVADRHGRRLKMGSYVFEPDLAHEVTIKWEGDSDVVHGIEPFAHLSPELRDWAYDARLVEPMVDIVGDDDPQLFTEKLNLKRREVGGPNPLHQDHPYWVEPAQDPLRVATSILFLDDTTTENGCLEVVPGSHRHGPAATRTDSDLFGNLEMAPAEPGSLTTVDVEVPAGSLVMFGSLLVHQSRPNRTDGDRRALLYSYQPAGHPHLLEHLRRLLGSRAP
jgi:ectoine hydroxylase-related dioxygenase (phytanoyl-CoA dioxygenase family)